MTEPIGQDEDVSPEDAFAVLGNETRIDIIQSLGETANESLSFSALRDRVNVDDSGQFNYHLNELVGSFVRRTDAETYELTYAGTQVIGAIVSGTYTQHGGSLTIDLDLSCSISGTTRTNTSVNSIGAYLPYHPAVVAFHHEHGINLTETPLWELPWLRNEETTVLSRDPWRVQSVVALEVIVSHSSSMKTIRLC